MTPMGAVFGPVTFQEDFRRREDRKAEQVKLAREQYEAAQMEVARESGNPKSDKYEAAWDLRDDPMHQEDLNSFCLCDDQYDVYRGVAMREWKLQQGGVEEGRYAHTQEPHTQEQHTLAHILTDTHTYTCMQP